MITPGGSGASAGSAPPHLSGEAIDDLIDGRLADGERVAAEAHLAGCPTCHAEYAAVRDVVALGRHSRGLVPAPPDLWTVIAATTTHEHIVRRHVLRSMRATIAVVAIAIAVASAFVATVVTRAVLRPEAAGPITGTVVSIFRMLRGGAPSAREAPQAPPAPTPPGAPGAPGASR